MSKRRWNELEEEERRPLQANSGLVEGEDAQVNKYKEKAETDKTDNAAVNSKAQPNDAQAQVMVCVQSAIEKVGRGRGQKEN